MYLMRSIAQKLVNYIQLKNFYSFNNKKQNLSFSIQILTCMIIRLLLILLEFFIFCIILIINKSQLMSHKKELQVKSVHRFTENANMKFRPLFYKLPQPIVQPNNSYVSKVSQILGNFFGNKPITNSKSTIIQNKNKTQTKSAILSPSPSKKNISLIQPYKKQSKIQDSPMKESPLKLKQHSKSQIKPSQEAQTVQLINKANGENSLIYLQKITIDTFLIGNQNQLDLITISGIYDNVIDTDINWSLNIHRPINKLSVDIKKCLIAISSQSQLLVYRFDIKKLKSQPFFIAKTKLIADPQYMIFLKDSQLGVFYQFSGSVYQIQQNNTIKIIFNKKYGVRETLKLYQIPKPVDNILNIFFIEKSTTSKTYILWRLQLQFKQITVNHSYKSIVRIYQIPSGLVNKFKVDNFSKDIMILNFKFQILAAKDGFIIDAANTNIQEDGSCLVYHGQHLLHISENKLFIYGFKIITTVKPNKIELRSLDSIQIKKDARYSFFNCLEMLNGNFVLFFQVKPQFNRKLKGQIDYIFTVTQKLSIQQKLNQIFSFKNPLELKDMAQNYFEKIQEKCDMAFKIGLSRKQIYLQLWNKSNKKEISDYKFLLDTMDYQTIKHQIEFKLKKASMPFNEVYKIEQACFQMLGSDLFSNSNCNQKAIKNYLISHFLLRKLSYFKNVNVNNLKNMKTVTVINSKGKQEHVSIFMIDIQQYVHTVSFQLKSHFMEYVTKLSIEEKSDISEKQKQTVQYNFRIFMRDFRFPLRIIYAQLLQNLIIHSKNKLINFLKAIPQILPYQSLQTSVYDLSLYQGLWGPINEEQWRKNLHIEQISTIYNKDYIEEITKTVWFKRNQNTLHDLVALSKQKIIQIQKFNQSENIFYLFIQKIFQYSKNQDHLIQVVNFLELTYEKMLPSHLKGKIFLYKKLFQYFEGEKYHHSIIASFNSFLKLKDHQLFNQLFKYQKIKKGCLLKDAKRIYQEIDDGIQLYYQGLLNYFASDLSQISDLKYILNRLNNQKRQFHMQNEGIYVVLVKAMQMKLKLGSENDIPLDEVMIYVENIPLSKNNPIIEDLKIVQRINEESERFKKMKINMSLLEIIQKCQDVVTALINEQIKQKNVLQIRNQKQLIDITYSILAQVQTIKDKIYKGRYSDLPYFIYLSKLLQVKQFIFYVDILLKDPHLLQYYCVDERLVQNLVLYMYKWKFSKESTFIKNKDYIEELLFLLEEDSQCRIYIESQIQFAIMLSTPQLPIEYPLTQSDTISIIQISAIINNRSAHDINKLDIVKLHEVIQCMQELSVQMEITSLQQIYQVCIMRLIQLNSIRDAIPMIKKLLKIYDGQENYSIIFCYLVLLAVINEMAEVHKKILMKIAFYTYNNPLDLLQIIEKRINIKISNDEQKAFLDGQLERVKQYKCFDCKNILLDQQIKDKLAENSQKYYHKIQDLIFQTWTHIYTNRDDFQRNPQFTFYFIMLLNNPYALAKYISFNQEKINIRLFRSYLSYVFKEDIFYGNNVLYFGRRIFKIVLQATVSLMSVQVVASQYKGNDLINDQLLTEFEELTYQNLSFQSKIKKSILTFNKKISSFKVVKPQEISKKTKRVQALLASEASIHEQQVTQYPFNDSDDNYQDIEDEGNKKVMVMFKKKEERHFDANKERKILMEREGRNLALYLSATPQDQLRRTSPKVLKSSKTFQHAFHSVHFTTKGRSKPRKTSDSMKNGVLDRIERADSIGMKEQFEQSIGLAISQSQDELFRSAQPILLRTQTHQQMVKTSPQRKEEQAQSPNSPVKLMNKNSTIQVNFLEDSAQNFQFNFKVTVNQINDQQFTPVQSIKKQLLADIGTQTDPIFDLRILANEEDKQFDDFQEYLRNLIECIYSQRGVALSLLLQLIKQIKNAYPQIGISSQLLEYYIALQNYNLKYKSQHPIREMFPISGIFLDTKDPIVLFQFVKNNILDIVSYDRIIVISRLLEVLSKHDIKDDLYISYLARQIQAYGNDNTSSELELKMQKERISGIMVHQITKSTLFIERGQAILKPITNKQRCKEIAQMIKDALRTKKKDYLIRQFEKKISGLNL